jgi:hypothetical protein
MLLPINQCTFNSSSGPPVTRVHVTGTLFSPELSAEVKKELVKEYHNKTMLRILRSLKFHWHPKDCTPRLNSETFQPEQLDRLDLEDLCNNLTAIYWMSDEEFAESPLSSLPFDRIFKEWFTH